MSAKGSTAVGVIVAILIVGAVGVIGYYQVEVAPFISTSTTTTSTTASVDCSATPSACVQVSIVSGAGISYAGYTVGSTTPYGYNVTGTDLTSFTVIIGVNNTVVWTNVDSSIHSITSVAGDPASFNDACISSATVPCPTPSPDTFQFTFTVPGTYVYHCTFHSWMYGKITVLAGSGGTTTTATSSTGSTSTGTSTSA